MRLILVRHAKAEDREKWINEDDLRRPLTKKGQKQAKKIAKFIKKQYPKVDAIISSLALRACDTAKYIAKLQEQSTFFLSPNLNPESSLEGYLKHKDEMDEEWKVVVMVGHEPIIGEFVESLCGLESSNLKIAKGCIIELEKSPKEFQEEWVLVGLRNF